MKNVTYDEKNNITYFRLMTPEAYSAFKMGYQNNDYRQFNRHEETRELQNVVVDNQKHSQIVVQYGNDNLLLKNR
jgi:hypothetical protein